MVAYDALGNEIVLGQRYGYSSNSGGSHRVTKGTAIKLSLVRGYTKVTLGDVSSVLFHYGNETTLFGERAETIAVFSRICFPIEG